MKIKWKSFFYENSEDSQVRTPPKNEHVNALETGLYDMVRNIEFKIVSSEFQSNLSKHIKRINEDPLLFIPIENTSNMNKLPKDNYNKLLTDTITNSCKKTQKKQMLLL